MMSNTPKSRLRRSALPLITATLGTALAITAPHAHAALDGVDYIHSDGSDGNGHYYASMRTGTMAPGTYTTTARGASNGVTCYLDGASTSRAEWLSPNSDDMRLVHHAMVSPGAHITVVGPCLWTPAPGV